MAKTPSRKRPCRICRRWFLPHPRLKDRQQTCGNSQCQREWHRRMCEQWNRKNPDYFKSNYLQKKLDGVNEPEKGKSGRYPKSRTITGLPLAYVQEVIGIQAVIIIEYLAQLLIRRCQVFLTNSLIVNSSQIPQLPGTICLRSDPHATHCKH